MLLIQAPPTSPPTFLPELLSKLLLEVINLLSYACRPHQSLAQHLLQPERQHYHSPFQIPSLDHTCLSMKKAAKQCID